MKLEITFYADTFRHTEIEIDDIIDKQLPLCSCNLISMGDHYCQRGKMIQNWLAEKMHEQFYYTGKIMLITGKKINI